MLTVPGEETYIMKILNILKYTAFALIVVFTAAAVSPIEIIIVPSPRAAVYYDGGIYGTIPEIPEPAEEPTEPTEPTEASGPAATETTEAAEEPETQEIPADKGPPVKKPKKEYKDKFDRLRDMYNGNEDIIGIIKIPGTVVYYPVAYYAYDNKYYLDRNLRKQFSAAGSIFLDYENSVERQDPNTVLYGHQMSVNSMFHTLRYYANEEYFYSHRYIIFNTVYENNVWEVFTFFRAHISFNYIRVFFRSERTFLELAAEMKERSLYETGIDIERGDRILTLSTCTNEDRDTRYVLAARLIKNKEDIPEDILIQMENAVEDFR